MELKTGSFACKKSLAIASLPMLFSGVAMVDRDAASLNF